MAINPTEVKRLFAGGVVDLQADFESMEEEGGKKSMDFIEYRWSRRCSKLVS